MNAVRSINGTLLVTLGDAGGLGPELAVRIFGNGRLASRWEGWRIVMVGSAASLEVHLARRGEPIFWTTLQVEEDPSNHPAGIYLLQPPRIGAIIPTIGDPSPEGGLAAGASLDMACDWLMEGKAQGVVTMPLHKAMLKAAGFDFPGHTEFLALRAGLDADAVTMHLCGETLRVSLVTTHPPLAAVPELITQEAVEQTIYRTDRFLFQLGVTPRRMAVCGLNPHAGESGTIGREEIEVIAPAVESALEQGCDVVGPLPGDTVFYRAAKGEFAAVVAMYHDQGLAPLKLLHFNEAVNVTLGLPFVRTSVDHGTGFDLAGTDTASPKSTIAALDLAARLITRWEVTCSAG